MQLSYNFCCLFRSKCCLWIFCICLQPSIWLREDSDSENATRCVWEIPLHWFYGLRTEDTEGWWTIQILHWFSCLLRSNCSTCYGNIYVFSLCIWFLRYVISICLWFLLRTLQMTWIFMNQIQKVEKSVGLWATMMGGIIFFTFTGKSWFESPSIFFHVCFILQNWAIFSASLQCWVCGIFVETVEHKISRSACYIAVWSALIFAGMKKQFLLWRSMCFQI